VKKEEFFAKLEELITAATELEHHGLVLDVETKINGKLNGNPRIIWVRIRGLIPHRRLGSRQDTPMNELAGSAVALLEAAREIGRNAKGKSNYVPAHLVLTKSPAAPNAPASTEVMLSLSITL
jgi:hypothetical protein